MILHSQIIGEGTPFIILHGFLGMSDNWKTLGRKFAERGYEMHLVDQRNHGRSFHDDAFSYEIMAEDLKAYCQHHEISEMVLLGHSMGGKTAMRFAASYPEMVTQLLVADIGPKKYPQHHQDILKALALLDFSKITSRNEADQVLEGYIKEVGTRQFLLKNLYWVEKGVLGLRMNLAVLTLNIEKVGKELPTSEGYTGATLFLRGGNSGYIDEMDVLGVKKQFPLAEISTIENVGHWLHAENPAEFYEIVMKFLQKETKIL